MAKIVGPMIILVEEDKNSNIGDSDMQEYSVRNGLGKSPFSKRGTKVNLALTS